jgi:hypothetical protein
MNAFIALHREQEMAEEDGPAGASSRDGQILRRVIRQFGSVLQSNLGA